ncbi:MAG: hypothetical protein VCB43_06330 [Myxococcota bacterium]
MQHESPEITLRRSESSQQIERCVQFALRGALANHCVHHANEERRRAKRHPFPYPVRLTPVDARGNATDETIIVLGKHLTSCGLDFYYQHAVSHRRVVATFDCEVNQRAELLMDLTWCRFSGHGWYENGGRFLSVVNPPQKDTPLGIAAALEPVLAVAEAAQM